MSYNPSLKQNSRFDSLKTASDGFRTRRPKNIDSSRRNFRDRIKKAAPPVYNFEETMFPEMHTTKEHTTNKEPVMDFTHIKDIKDKKPIKKKGRTLAEGWIRYVKLSGVWYAEEYVYDTPLEECKSYRLRGCC